MELEVYKKSDFYEDYIDSQKEYYERTNADAYFAERLAEKDELIASLQDTNKVLAHNGVRLNKMLDEKDKEIARQNIEIKETVKTMKSLEMEIIELKQKLENVQASMYADVVDANMEVRRLKRALYIVLARSFCCMRELAARNALYDDECKWDNFKTTCLKKAEEYK